MYCQLPPNQKFSKPPTSAGQNSGHRRRRRWRVSLFVATGLFCSQSSSLVPLEAGGYIRLVDLLESATGVPPRHLLLSISDPQCSLIDLVAEVREERSARRADTPCLQSLIVLLPSFTFRTYAKRSRSTPMRFAQIQLNPVTQLTKSLLFGDVLGRPTDVRWNPPWKRDGANSVSSRGRVLLL